MLAPEIYVDSWGCGTVVPRPTAKIWDCAKCSSHRKDLREERHRWDPRRDSTRRLTSHPRQRRHRENDQGKFDRMSPLYPEAWKRSIFPERVLSTSLWMFGFLFT